METAGHVFSKDSFTNIWVAPKGIYKMKDLVVKSKHFIQSGPL